jgi:hypothetical protein
MIVAVIASITFLAGDLIIPATLLDCVTGLRNGQTENSHAVRAKICERIAPGAQRRISQSKFFKPFRGLETLSSREKVTSQQRHAHGGAGRIRTTEQEIMSALVRTEGRIFRLKNGTSFRTFDWTSSPRRACMQNSRDR